MAEETRLTPEKQLLNLIEKPKAQGAQKEQGSERNRLGSFSVPVLKLKILNASKWLQNYLIANNKELFTVKRLRGFFQVLSALLVVYILVFFVFSLRKMKKMDFFALQQKNSPDSSFVLSAGRVKEMYPAKDVKIYLEPLKKRNIFIFASNQPSVSVGVDAISQLTEGLKLVGISFSDYPEAIIEDDKDKKTYFVKEGSYIGKLLVKKISKEAILLGYNGEEKQLR